MNNAGDIAFLGTTAGEEGIYLITAGTNTISTIADTTGELAYVRRGSLSEAGRVAFLGGLDQGGQVIYSGTPTGIDPIIDTSGVYTQFGSEPALNSAGDVVFRAKNSSNEWGIYRYTSTGIQTIADQHAGFNNIHLGGFYNIPSINEAGSVAFVSGQGSSDQQLFVWSNGQLATPLDDDPSVFIGDWSPQIGDDNTIVFTGQQPEIGRGVYLHNGSTVSPLAIADVSQFDFWNASRNSSGDIAFNACFLDQDGCVAQGILVGDQQAIEVLIRQGDPLFGSIVHDVLFNEGLNDQGAIAFAYRLEDGTQGIALAEPVILEGDFNSDGMVTPADYTVWRDNLGATGLEPYALGDGTGDGNITDDDYHVWQSQYGMTADMAVASDTKSVPEPGGVATLLCLAVFGSLSRVVKKLSKGYQRSAPSVYCIKQS